jgi:hypothetical protein
MDCCLFTYEIVFFKLTYNMMYFLYVSGSPCLSFDIIRDNLGEKRELHPLCAYVVAGTQAARTHTNNVLVMKVRKDPLLYSIVASCGLVVRVPGCRSRGPGSLPGGTRFSEK